MADTPFNIDYFEVNNLSFWGYITRLELVN